MKERGRIIEVEGSTITGGKKRWIEIENDRTALILQENRKTSQESQFTNPLISFKEEIIQDDELV